MPKRAVSRGTSAAPASAPQAEADSSSPYAPGPARRETLRVTSRAPLPRSSRSSGTTAGSRLMWATSKNTVPNPTTSATA
ncbi:hypothetical protein [Nonomuraea sp. NPDC005501]|uniref:hypothetical protein n=1 Tax=Nonomuraea sp. NPDC005501 TaxID=3156884 RepID=UPI0033B31E37